MQDLYKAARALEPELISLRRTLHRYPETGWTEFHTTARIITYLKDLGIPVAFGPDVICPDHALGRPNDIEAHCRRAVADGADAKLVAAMQGYTGAVADIRSGRPGPTVAFRFDIDALDIPESASQTHLPTREGFCSHRPGIMHACGHDAHTAIGLVLAKLLAENTELWNGRVRILFQPAEEGVRGARAMTETGILDSCDAVFGIHIYPTDGPSPAIAGTQLGLYATTKLDVTITGHSAHAGGAPEQGSSAILAAVHAISGMQAFLQDSRGASRLNIGTIGGGTSRNVVPDLCTFRAETRSSSTEAEQRLHRAAVRSIETACELFDCTCDIRIVGSCPTADGDTVLAARLAKAVLAAPDIVASVPVRVNTGTTDDFAYMLRRLHEHGRPGCYMALLTELAGGLHSNTYDINENCLVAGVEACLTALFTVHA